MKYAFSVIACALVSVSVVTVAALFIGCGNSPTKVADNAKTDNGKNKGDPAQALLKSTVTGASDAHQDLAANDEAAARTAAPPAPDTVKAAGVEGMGSAASPDKKEKPKATMYSALLKRAAPASSVALAKVSAAGDSAWFVYADTAQGRVAWVHAYVASDSAGAASARDSLVYKWPYNVSNPVVLFHAKARAYADGSSLNSGLYDDDGDGILNEAKPGTNIRLRKVTVFSSDDTVRKVILFSENGQTTYYDSLPAGHVLSWSDSTWVKGKNVAWQKVYDGDGDGYALEAASGKAVKIKVDSYADNGDGTYAYYYETFGPGPDGDWFSAADNERYPFTALLVDDHGSTLRQTSAGDDDGDGFYWTPAAGAANRAWERHAYSDRNGYQSYQDTVIKLLHGPGAEDDQVAYQSANILYPDGRKASITSKPLGAAAFGPRDSMETRVFVSYQAYVPSGPGDSLRTLDSTLRVLHVIPNLLDDPSDDQITWSFSQDFCKFPRPLRTRQITFAAAVPARVGQAPQAGEILREEKYDATGHALVRLVRWDGFDAAAGTRQWKESRYFADGDSSVASGGSLPGGGIGYAAAPVAGVRVTGSFDPATHAFADTLTWTDAKQGAPAQEVRAGKYDAAAGTGDFDRKLVTAQGDSAVRHLHLTKHSDGSFTLAASSASDSAIYALRGDSAILEADYGNAHVTYACARTRDPSDGSPTGYALGVTGKDASGALLLTGALAFGPDGSGAGSLVPYSGGRAQSAVSAAVGKDGSGSLDGVPPSDPKIGP